MIKMTQLFPRFFSIINYRLSFAEYRFVKVYIYIYNDIYIFMDESMTHTVQGYLEDLSWEQKSTKLL